MSNQVSEFYVGYLPKPPVKLRRFLRKVVFALLALALFTAVVLVIAQKPFAASFFEFGQVRNFEGTILAKPYPTLLVTRPGKTGGWPSTSAYLLVASGKHGADSIASSFDGKVVRLKGKLIHRDGNTMIEVESGSITSTGVLGMGPEHVRDLGPVSLSGEIVDSKCYLGVMNPGNGKVHRDCAARCISGGVPPIFVTADGRRTMLIVDSEGRPIARDILQEFVAEPITIAGRLLESDEQMFLKIDTASLHHIH